MNIPLPVARAQGPHGIKGAAHGIKGGRPRLNLSEAERRQRRLDQHAAYRRRKGIPPRPPRPYRIPELYRPYFEVWGKLPGEPLTDDDLEKGNAILEARFAANQGKPIKKCTPPPPPPPPLYVGAHPHSSCPCGSGRKFKDCCREEPAIARRSFDAPLIGRNHPCPCGSGRKFKKCCG